MATERMMPQIFGVLHPLHGTPQWCIIIICMLTAAAVLLPFDILVEFSCFWSCIAYVIEFLAFVKLRVTVPHRSKDAYMLPGGICFAIVLVAIPILLCGVILYLTSATGMVFGGVSFLISMIYYQWRVVPRLTKVGIAGEKYDNI